MKRIRATAVGVIFVLLLSACGGAVDESQLPTPVPTYGPERFAMEPGAMTPADPAPAVTPAPAPPEPTVEAPATEVPEAVEEVEAPVDGIEAPMDEEAAVDEEMEDEEAAEEITPEDALDEEVDETDEEAVDGGLLPTPSPAAAPASVDETDNEVTEKADAGTREDTELEATPAPVEAAADDDASEDEVAADEEAAVEDVDAADEEADLHPDWEGMPEHILAVMETADPARGQQLSLAQGCIGCHALDPDQIMAGPTWYNMAGVARTRVEGESAGLYLYNSIMYPNDFLVEGYLPNLMLQIYEDVLTDQETADIITYLLTLEENE